ncbi:MAG TPA: hypothetical protein ENJ28_04110 [Gammaproteobacteria bacterium]|nr:hypothetical protein [Gammaproteobacteria bacterium]
MRIIIILLALLFATPVMAADSYLCIAEQAAGFSYDKKSKKWKSTIFDTQDKIILKKPANEKNYKIFHHGETESASECWAGFNKTGFIYCNKNEIGKDFTMNIETLRFQYINTVGYVVNMNIIKQGREGNFTPFMQIGKCSKI